jgi:hypothetical protein
MVVSISYELKIYSSEFPYPAKYPVFGSTESQLFNGLNALPSWLAGLRFPALRSSLKMVRSELFLSLSSGEVDSSENADRRGRLVQ